MKKFEYKEPEFKVVITKSEDVITTSGEPAPSGHLNTVSNAWEMGTFQL